MKRQTWIGAGLACLLCWAPGNVHAGLVSYWALDSLDGGSQFADTGGDQDSPGTPAGNAAVDAVEKKIGAGSVLLDGNGDYVDVGQGDLLLTGATALTITAWVNTDTTSGTRGIVGRTTGGNASYVLRLDSGGLLRAGVYTDVGWNITLNDASAIATDTWTHVAMVYDGSTLTRYINGVATGTVKATSGTALGQQGTAKDAAIGDIGVGGNSSFDGNLDDVAIFDMALTSTQIAALAGETATPLTVVPEPGSIFLAVLGLLSVAGWAGRRRA